MELRMGCLGIVRRMLVLGMLLRMRSIEDQPGMQFLYVLLTNLRESQAFYFTPQAFFKK